MTKKTKQTRSDATAVDDDTILVTADVFLPLFPVPTTYEQLLRFERSKKFPKALRIVSQRAAPLWPVNVVIDWINANFPQFPKHCVRAERVLKAHTGSPLVVHGRSKPRTVVYRVPDGEPHFDSLANCRDLVRVGAYRWGKDGAK